MEIDMDELRGPFFEDALDHLESIDTTLSRLEEDANDEQAIGEMFRSVHSLKGDSGALGFGSLEKMLHEFETILDGIRIGERTLTPDTTDLFCQAMNLVEQLVAAARDDAPLPDGYDEILALLVSHENVNAAEASAIKENAGQENVADGDDSIEGFGLFETSEVDDADDTNRRLSAITESLSEVCANLDYPAFGEFLILRGRISQNQGKEAIAHQIAEQPLLGALLLEAGNLSVRQVSETLLHANETCERFGEAAVQLGFVDASELDAALVEQRKRRPSFCDCLLQLGSVDRDALEAELVEYSVEFPDAAAEVILPEPEAVAEDDDEDFDSDPDLMAEFIVESKEHLENAEEQLLVIESDSGNAEALNAIYRAFHTIKGVSSFLGLEATRNLAHESESMLNLARDGKLVLTGDAFEVSLASVDGLKRQVGFAEEWLSTQGKLNSDPQLPKLLAAIDSVAKGTAVGELPDRMEVVETVPEKVEPTKEVAARRASTQIRESIKVDRDRLDKLINVIGELVIGQAMVEAEVAAWQQEIGHESLAMSQLTKTVRDLQELSLSLRMVPVGTVFHKMARIVRDLGRKLGKDIRFETEGNETELDKTVVDQIGDPLMHMVRNAADHGIESVEERLAAGKPAQGRIVLRAYHQGGNIYIEIQDDGKGLDRAALLRKAIERGIVAETDTLSESDIDNLIFAPGFSTAKQVTDVSGRGVGMDVVRRNVEALQGSVSIQSKLGSGSTVVIRLPLTLAILDGLSIRISNEVYIVPILSVVESFSSQPGDIRNLAAKGEVVMVRGEVVPLLRLSQLLGLAGTEENKSADSLVVIVEDRGKKFALMVDELVGQSQVVIKNLETNFRKVDGIAGATILGDGRIAMILDVYGLVSLASQVPASTVSNVYRDSNDSTDESPDLTAIQETCAS